MRITPPNPQQWSALFISTSSSPGMERRISRAFPDSPCPLPRWHGSCQVTRFRTGRNESPAISRARNSWTSRTAGDFIPDRSSLGYSFLNVKLQEAQAVTMASAPVASKRKVLRSACNCAAARSPRERSGRPQHFRPPGTITSYPSRSRTVLTDLPISCCNPLIAHPGKNATLPCFLADSTSPAFEL